MANHTIHAQLSLEILHQLTPGLQLRGGHLRLSLVIALEAHADRAPVAAFGVRADCPERTATRDAAILADKKVVADASPPPVKMPVVYIRCRTRFGRSVVQDDQVRDLTGRQFVRPVVVLLDDVHQVSSFGSTLSSTLTFSRLIRLCRNPGTGAPSAATFSKIEISSLITSQITTIDAIRKSSRQSSPI